MDDNKKIVDDFKDVDDMVTHHRVMTKGLITGSSHMTNGEAHNANNAFGKQLAYLKLVLEAYKTMGIIPKKEDLFLKEDK